MASAHGRIDSTQIRFAILGLVAFGEWRKQSLGSLGLVHHTKSLGGGQRRYNKRSRLRRNATKSCTRIKVRKHSKVKTSKEGEEESPT